LNLGTVDVTNENHAMGKDFQEEQASTNVSSDIYSGQPVDDLNDGFISPTAWKTRSRAKGYNNRGQHLFLLTLFCLLIYSTSIFRFSRTKSSIQTYSSTIKTKGKRML
jgi:hypothetical protein